MTGLLPTASNAGRRELESIAIAGVWGYIGRKVLDAALRRGLRVDVLDPGLVPVDASLSAVRQHTDPAVFYSLQSDLFHLAVHPEVRSDGLTRLLERAGSEQLFILNEKPIVAPESPEEASALVEAVDRSQAVMLFDFPELFDPLTHRITEYLAGFRSVELESIQVQRSKDREDPELARNYKRMLPIQFQESVHCIAYVLYLLATLRGDLEGGLDAGISTLASSEPYSPPNPQDYPHMVDGRCRYELRLGKLAVQGETNFKRGAPWSKRRVIEGLADGRPFRIDADYLEGKKYLRIDGVDQGWEKGANSYEAILTTLTEWRGHVSRHDLLHGVYPNPRLAWLAFQLSGLLWRSSHDGRRLHLPSAEALKQFDSGFAAVRPRLPRYARQVPSLRTETGSHAD